MTKGYIRQAWLVLILSLCFGGALAGVQVALRDRIAQNKLAETLGQIPKLVPGAGTGEAETISGQTVYRALKGADQVGWVIPCGGQGFADRIEVLVGLDSGASTLTGIYVLDQKETPGLGNKIVEDEWRAQFAGLSALQPLRVARAGQAGDRQIDSITGATISSESVCDIVNQALGQWRQELAARASEDRGS